MSRSFKGRIQDVERKAENARGSGDPLALTPGEIRLVADWITGGEVGPFPLPPRKVQISPERVRIIREQLEIARRIESREHQDQTRRR